MEKQKKYIWHPMNDWMLIDQPFYLWDGKKTKLCIRNTMQFMLDENNLPSYIAFNHPDFKDYRWAYVNQDLELRPTPEPENKIYNFSAIPISELNLSKKVFHLLKIQDVDSVQDIIKLKKQGIMNLKKIGTLSFVEINDSLKPYMVDLNNL